MSFTSARRMSCGTVILHPRRELLLCHVTGQDHWDLPKGGIDSAETTREAALRETREETGLVLAADELFDLGRLRYTAKKDLHLYAIVLPGLDPATLRCESWFIDRWSGRRRPEMDGYAWVRFDAIASRCTSNLTELLRDRLDLDRLLAELTPPAALAA
ncbi:MAG: NUDIX domain-containing protein [Proteobacteria bacterium]|nr:NUDIX domain-containing protein [Pseudomonadota bacterium]